jgi:uncharacterized tellurite resistance protein B-like protein
MATTNPDHPALALDEKRRVDYVMVVASMVYVDGVVDPKEQTLLGSLCRALGLPDETSAEVLKTAGAPGRPDAKRLAHSFEDHEVRMSLLTDAIVMAYADGKVAAAEADAIAAFADAMGFTASQAALVARYVATVHGASPAMQSPLDSMIGRQMAKGITGEHQAIKDEPLPEKQQGVIKWLFKKLRGK